MCPCHGPPVRRVQSPDAVGVARLQNVVHISQPCVAEEGISIIISIIFTTQQLTK